MTDAGRLLDEDPLDRHPELLGGVELEVGLLIAGRDTGIEDRLGHDHDGPSFGTRVGTDLWQHIRRLLAPVMTWGSKRWIVAPSRATFAVAEAVKRAPGYVPQWNILKPRRAGHCEVDRSVE